MGPTPVRCRIPELLHKIGKNQQWLAGETGLGKQRISDICNMRVKNIQLSTGVLIASKIGCRERELFVWEWRQQE